jgi:hypothetical protein
MVENGDKVDLSAEAQMESRNIKTEPSKWEKVGEFMRYVGLPENISTLQKEIETYAEECELVVISMRQMFVLT